MTAKQIKFSSEAREGMFRGIDTLAGAVSVTLGPRGRNVAIDRSFGARITKDGVSVAREIELGDKFENMGVRMVRESAIRASYLAGDGTTTAVVLARAILRNGTRAVAAGMNPMDMKRGIDRAVKTVVAELGKNARSVVSNADIAHIGTIAANGDIEVGRIIADAMGKVGNSGVVLVEEGTTLRTELEFVAGIQFDRSYISPHFVTNRKKMAVEMEDALVLLSEKKLSNTNELLPLLEKVVQTGKPLLIIADDFEGEVSAALIVNKLRGSLKVAAVKGPAYGDLRRSILQDIALLTGGTVLSDELGLKLEELQLDFLGRAKKVTVDKQNTTIAGDAAGRGDVDARIVQLRAQLEENPSDYDREKLQERLARLTGGIAVIRVGGATEIEVREKRDRIRNAVHATRSALEEGVLPGGGVALLRASRAIGNLETDNADQNAGIAIVRDAITWPARQIATNAGQDGSAVVARILESTDSAFGYDAQSGRYGDLLSMGIIDPARAVRLALEGAASVAGLLITTEVMVAELPGPPPPELPGHHDHDDHLDMEF
ncbi:60 kDa chaperonin 3 [Mesorhizobium sp. L-8-10]|uniref:chaperonin GroEL n=1 Tax=Mesorhizobium sp. L-8-10 TaxID=2744523 RepID=UPI001926866A|nr:chaperonin GroEL [Mesorhizobium sp. L-8-10]BCH30587.1 60 kDa chaperonin 3 [Mesorhizobium sp. L-8-10]